jgi:FkbM family methyltransferase
VGGYRGEDVMNLARAVVRRLRSLGGRQLTPNAGQTPRNYYGLNQLDERLESYVDFDNGIFVEAGANDGQTQSNTAYFARHRGWRGLLVEPIPELAGRCRIARPESIVENCALVDANADGQSVSMTYCGLMSVVDGGWREPEAERAHIESGRQIQSLTTYHLDVPGRSLSTLLDKHKIENVDLLSLDVEGFERQALEGLDLQRHRPRFILVEARFRDEIDRLLLPHYDVVAELSHHDVLYRVKAI